MAKKKDQTMLYLLAGGAALTWWLLANRKTESLVPGTGEEKGYSGWVNEDQVHSGPARSVLGTREGIKRDIDAALDKSLGCNPKACSKIVQRIREALQKEE